MCIDNIKKSEPDLVEHNLDNVNNLDMSTNSPDILNATLLNKTNPNQHQFKIDNNQQLFQIWNNAMFTRRLMFHHPAKRCHELFRRSLPLMMVLKLKSNSLIKNPFKT